MLEHVGEDNIFIFGGNTAEQVEALRRNGYKPREFYEQGSGAASGALTQIPVPGCSARRSRVAIAICWIR